VEIVEVAGGEALERWLAVQNAVFPRRKSTATGLHDWRRQAEDMVWLLASEDGADAGTGLSYVGWFSLPGVAGGEIAVLPDRRGRGIGSALYSALSVWAAARGARELDLHVGEDDPDSLAWTERRGFVEVGRNARMVLDLTALDEPAVEPPPGVEIVSWSERPELAQGIYEAAREAHPDIPGEEDVEIGSFEEWLSRDMQGAGDRAEGVFVAVAGGEVAGYAKLAFGEETETVYHDLTAVRRAWRGRGIARALKATQIGYAKRQGYRKLQTQNEERNAPIRALNQRFGYVLEPGTVTMRGPLAK